MQLHLFLITEDRNKILPVCYSDNRVSCTRYDNAKWFCLAHFGSGYMSFTFTISQLKNIFNLNILIICAHHFNIFITVPKLQLAMVSLNLQMFDSLNKKNALLESLKYKVNSNYNPYTNRCDKKSHTF